MALQLLLLAALAAAATMPACQAHRLRGEKEPELEWGRALFQDAGNGTFEAAVRPTHRRLTATVANANTPAFCVAAPTGPIMAGNLIYNANGVRGVAGWFGFAGCTVTSVPGFGGVNYIVAKNRQSTNSAPAQVVWLVPGYYEFVAWVRLSPGADTFVMTTLKQSDTVYTCVGAIIGKSRCWTKVQGGFSIQQATSGTIYVEGPPAWQDVSVASMSITRVNTTTWRAEQNTRIDALRKRPIQLRVLNKCGQPIDVEAKIDQTESAFPFGGGLNGAITVDRNYQRWFKARFNWAVFQNEMKWYYTEAFPNWLNYVDADNMLKWCLTNGIKVRGHNIFWEVAGYVQSWVQALSNSDLMAAMQRRVAGVVSRYAGKVEHWDVDNELLHGNFYNGRLGPSIQPWMFERTRQLDSTAKLFMNDYNVVEQCGDPNGLPETYLNKLWSLQSSGARIQGIGAEAHFSDEPQAVRVKHDLDMLSLAGIPVWITELDVQSPDYQLQASYLETVMREAFSHPAVQGIMLWQTARPPCSEWNYYDPGLCGVCTNCLADENWVDRPLGAKYVRLRKEWSTHLWTRTGPSGTLNFRGFHGQYRARLTVNGILYTQYFEVPVGTTPQLVRLTLPI